MACVYNIDLPYTNFLKEMVKGKYDFYFDDALRNFVTLRIANYIDAWLHDIMSCNMILVHDIA
jgi:hypothetical protein